MPLSRTRFCHVEANDRSGLRGQIGHTTARCRGDVHDLVTRARDVRFSAEVCTAALRFCHPRARRFVKRCRTSHRFSLKLSRLLYTRDLFRAVPAAIGLTHLCNIHAALVPTLLTYTPWPSLPYPILCVVLARFSHRIAASALPFHFMHPLRLRRGTM